jgi:hypothetical protein
MLAILFFTFMPLVAAQSDSSATPTSDQTTSSVTITNSDGRPLTTITGSVVKPITVTDSKGVVITTIDNIIQSESTTASTSGRSTIVPNPETASSTRPKPDPTTPNTTTATSTSATVIPLKPAPGNDDSLSNAAKGGIAAGVIIFVIFLALSVLFGKYLYMYRKGKAYQAPTANHAWPDEQTLDLEQRSTVPLDHENEESQSTAPPSRPPTFIEFLTHGSVRSGRMSRKQVVPGEGLELRVRRASVESHPRLPRPHTFMEHLFRRQSRASERNWRKEVQIESGPEIVQGDPAIVSPLGPTSTDPSPIGPSLTVPSPLAHIPSPLGAGTQLRGDLQELPSSQTASSRRSSLTKNRANRRRSRDSQPHETFELLGSTYHSLFKRIRRPGQRSQDENTPGSEPSCQVTPNQPPPLFNRRQQAQQPQQTRPTVSNNFKAIPEEERSRPVSPIESQPSLTQPGFPEEELYVTPDTHPGTDNRLREPERQPTPEETHQSVRVEQDQQDRIGQRMAEHKRSGRDHGFAD